MYGCDSLLTFSSFDSHPSGSEELLDLSDNFSSSLSRTNKTLEVVENLSGWMRQSGSEAKLNVPCIHLIVHIVDYGG